MAVAEKDMIEVPAQRRRAILSKDNIKLGPGQFLIKTPEQTVIQRDNRGHEVTVRVAYNGTAYGVKFENNVAVIDDTSVREIREFMLDELEGDENRLPPWFRRGKAEDLARAFASDFGYEVTPELPKLRKMSKVEIYKSSRIDGETIDTDESLYAQAPADRPGQNTEQPRRATPSAARALPGVDDAGLDEGREGMPEQPPVAAAKVDRRPESWKNRGKKTSAQKGK